jgi:adenosylcobyric acid synthase
VAVVTADVGRGALMVCGTTSDAGKTTVVTGLCRVLARRGVRVAPFKAQNMALNSAVTVTGHEIGRAQVAQAQAAGVEPEVAMNPVLLKPTSDRTSQVIVDGRPWAVLDAAEYQKVKPELLGLVLDRLADLRSRYDVVLCEGAGSPAEINLLDHDIVNLRVARRSGMRALVVGDIDRGGVFAALWGTVALLPDELRELVGGFVINKLRGDPTLLGDGPAQLEARCGVPTLGVLPWTGGIGIDAEDSLALDLPPSSPAVGAQGGTLDVAAVRFPRVSNFTDLDPLITEPGVALRWVDHARSLGRPDLVVLPGSKATVSDLAWLRRTGLAEALCALAGAAEPSTTVVGICGGYQMLGRSIHDPIEAGVSAPVDGLGLLAVTTRFGPDKVLAQRRGTAWGHPVQGYQIHHGRSAPEGGPDGPWLSLDGRGEGAQSAGGAVLGSSLHGLFEADGFRTELLAQVSRRAGAGWLPSGRSFAGLRQDRFDRLADLLEDHLDLTAVDRLIAGGDARGAR